MPPSSRFLFPEDVRFARFDLGCRVTLRPTLIFALKAHDQESLVGGAGPGSSANPRHRRPRGEGASDVPEARNPRRDGNPCISWRFAMRLPRPREEASAHGLQTGAASYQEGWI